MPHHGRRVKTDLPDLLLYAPAKIHVITGGAATAGATATVARIPAAIADMA